jgi:S-adenosyl methyltransferase
MERPDWAPTGVDPTVPSVARVYDYYLGGSHNFAADRTFAAGVLRALPGMARVAQENRAFLRRAVSHLAALGVDQFLDLGSGIPTVGNVHEVARAACGPAARVVYVDHDPVAVAHGRALLSDDPTAAIVQADLTDVEPVLAHPIVSDHLDLDRPVAVLLISVLHFVPDAADPAGILRRYAAGLAGGGFVAVSHASSEGVPAAEDAEAVYNRAGSPHSMRMRSAAEVEQLLAGIELLPPGVVRIPLWRPDPLDDVPVDAATYPGYAVVARVEPG